MHIDPVLPTIVTILLAILIAGAALTRLKQPHVIGYLIAGVILGPDVIGLINDKDVITRLGNIGVVLLLFFIGMEVSPKRLMASWRIAVIGTLAQIILSVICVVLIGNWLDWPLGRSVMLGFVISLSSTAVVLKILQDKSELDTDTGQNVLGVLLFQDMAIIPMIIIMGVMGGAQMNTTELATQIGGGILMLAIVTYIVIKDTIKLPVPHWVKKDHELQLFMALAICLSLTLLTGMMHLSTALGAFIGGMIVGVAKETQWVHHNLNPFRILFVALFFVSVGLLVNIEFIANYWKEALLLSALALIFNMITNTMIIRLLGDSWPDSVYSGALLAQIGEFSFVLAAIGLQNNLVSQHGYQMTIAVIVITLAVSPTLISITKRLTYKNKY